MERAYRKLQSYKTGKPAYNALRSIQKVFIGQVEQEHSFSNCAAFPSMNRQHHSKTVAMRSNKIRAGEKGASANSADCVW